MPRLTTAQCLVFGCILGILVGAAVASSVNSGTAEAQFQFYGICIGFCAILFSVCGLAIGFVIDRPAAHEDSMSAESEPESIDSDSIESVSSETLAPESPPVGKQNLANVLLILGGLVCLYGFYGITKFALGFLFPQSAAFLRLMILFLVMYALVVAGGAGLIMTSERLKEGRGMPSSSFLAFGVCSPLIAAVVIRILVQLW